MSIEKIINEAWENKDQVSQNSDKSLVEEVLVKIKTSFEIGSGNNYGTIMVRSV